jgi:hypothetical protein
VDGTGVGGGLSITFGGGGTWSATFKWRAVGSVSRRALREQAGRGSGHYAAEASLSRAPERCRAQKAALRPGNNRDEILLEPKDSMKRRGVSSPDIADALAATSAEEVATPPGMDRGDQFVQMEWNPFSDEAVGREHPQAYPGNMPEDMPGCERTRRAGEGGWRHSWPIAFAAAGGGTGLAGEKRSYEPSAT